MHLRIQGGVAQVLQMDGNPCVLYCVTVFCMSSIHLHLGSKKPLCYCCNMKWGFLEGTVAWTENPKLGVGGSLMVANDVSIPKECFPKVSELLKRNWPRAAHI